MGSGTIFLIIWCILAIYALTTLYKRGKKALAIFPDIELVNVLYRDKSASGYSTKSWATRMGGANKALDIVVTDEELWFKSMLFFASTGKQHDLLHRISLNNISGIDRNGKKIKVKFRTAEGEDKEVIVITKRPDEFVEAITK